MKSFNEKKASQLYEKGKEESSNLYQDAKDQVSNAADQIKSTASNIYKQGVNKVQDMEGTMSDYSDELIRSIKRKPLMSVCIAGGIGYLLAKFFSK